MRITLILVALMSSVLSWAAYAQEELPYPRPRPADRGGTVVSTQNPGTQAQSGDALEAIDEIAPKDAATTELTKPLTDIPQPVTLSAKITEDGPLIPNGLVWRVYSVDPQQPGALDLVGRSTNAAAVFNLAPGEYQAHVAYGNAQEVETILVDAAPLAKTMILDSGALRLNALITGDIPIQPNLLRFEIYPSDADEDHAAILATDVAPGDIIQLNAGIYHVVSRYGGVNAIVRADLRVEPGQITDATLFHDASAISFKLQSEIGGDAIADVQWTVKNSVGETVFSELGAFPNTILAGGEYTVFAEQGGKVYNRDFQVAPGPQQEIAVLTNI